MLYVIWQGWITILFSETSLGFSSSALFCPALSQGTKLSQRTTIQLISKMNGNRDKAKIKRANFSTPITVCSPQQHLQEISFFESQQQSWNPLYQQERAFNGWKTNICNLKHSLFDPQDTRPIKLYRSSATQRVCLDNRRVGNFGVFSSGQLLRSPGSKQICSERTHRSTICSRLSSELGKSTIQTAEHQQPKAVHRNYLRKKSNQQIKNRKNLSKQRQSYSISGVNYPIVLNNKQELLIKQQQVYKIGSIYDLLSKRMRMKAE